MPQAYGVLCSARNRQHTDSKTLPARDSAEHPPPVQMQYVSRYEVVFQEKAHSVGDLFDPARSAQGDILGERFG